MTRRRIFLNEQREAARARFNRQAEQFDSLWGAFTMSHMGAVADLVQAVPPSGVILDAACGNGKYWELIAAAGRQVFGIDHSEALLALAHGRFPDVEFRELALQDLAATTDLHGRFDGLMCVDAMEWIGPEDWAETLNGFRRALRPGAHAYVSIELPDEEEVALLRRPVADGLMPGEIVLDGSYAYYPDMKAVERWLGQSGFALRSTRVGGGYRHLQLQVCEL